MVALAATAVGRVGSDSLTFGNRQQLASVSRSGIPQMPAARCGAANDPAGQLIDCDGHWHATRIPGRPCTAPGGGTVTRAG